MARLNSTTEFPLVDPNASDRINGTDVSDTSNSADGQCVQFLVEHIGVGIPTTVVDTSTGLGEYNVTLPAGVQWIEVLLFKVSTNGSANLEIRFLVDGADVSSGYDSGSSGDSSTSGFTIRNESSGDVVTATMILQRFDGNDWLSVHNGRRGGNSVMAGSGSVTLAGDINGIQLFLGGSTGDAGKFRVRYK